MVCKHSSNTSSESYGNYRNDDGDIDHDNNSNEDDEDDDDDDAVANHEARLGWWFSRYSGAVFNRFIAILEQASSKSK